MTDGGIPLELNNEKVNSKKNVSTGSRFPRQTVAPQSDERRHANSSLAALKDLARINKCNHRIAFNINVVGINPISLRIPVMIQTTASSSRSPELPSVISLDVALKANELFRTCPYSSIRNVQCRFHEGVLILSGEVPSFHMKQTAQELIRHVLHVEQIDNRLNVVR